MKLIKFKLERVLKNWNYFQFLRTNGILVFSQNLSLDAFKDLYMHITLRDQNYKWKFVSRYIIKELMDKKFLIKIKNFRNILIINDINNLKYIEQFFKKNKILILGFFIQNVFFYKKDFDIKKIDKKNIINNLKKRIGFFYLMKKKLIMQFKNPIIKLLMLLKKKS